MEPLISIVSLIYKSPTYAKCLWEMLQRTTPELASGEAEFFFVANDATDEVLECLEYQEIPHVRHHNPHRSEKELFALGYGKPEYLHRVYRGWNRGICDAKADCVVVLSSDHVMLPGWLCTLRDKWHRRLALSTLTIEPARHMELFPSSVGGGTGAVRGDHGCGWCAFDVEGFETQAQSLVRNVMTRGGAHQPTMFSKTEVIHAGMYPEGNLHAGTFNRIKEYGDRRLFRILAQNGVEHKTYHGTVAYHFQEGEMREGEEA